MTAIKAYYDGTTFVPLQKYPFRPSQQVLIVVDERTDARSPAEEFLKLAWEGGETAEEILAGIGGGRAHSARFGAEHWLFD